MSQFWQQGLAHIASGPELDRIGAMCMMPRCAGESDDDYRTRLLRHLTWDSSVGMSQSLKWRLLIALRDDAPELFVTRDEDLVLRQLGSGGSYDAGVFLGLCVIVVDVVL